MSNMRRALATAVLALLGVASVASGEAPQGELMWPAVNTGHVLREKTTGSFGHGTRERTIWFLGEQVREGMRVMIFTDGVTETHLDSQRRILAFVRGGKVVQRFEPYFVNAVWPLAVGKSWSSRHRYIDYERRRTFDNARYDGEVLAYEEVAVPAGTFKAFKVRLGDRSTTLTHWYSPELGFNIKSTLERLEGYYLGPGARETELVSYDLRK